MPNTLRSPTAASSGGYDASISYSRAADCHLAAAVQTGLQSLNKPWHRRRALRVFRDKAALPATPTLRTSIEKAPDFGPPYWYLAREELGAGRVAEAKDLALRGLAAQPVSEVAPLGHYVLADVYNREGRADAAREEVAKAQRMESALRRNPLRRS